MKSVASIDIRLQCWSPRQYKYQVGWAVESDHRRYLHQISTPDIYSYPRYVDIHLAHRTPHQPHSSRRSSAPRYLLPAVSGYLLGKTSAEFLWKLNKLYEPTSSTSPQLCSISVLFTQFVMILDIIIPHMINKSFIVRQGTRKPCSIIRCKIWKKFSTIAAICIKVYIIDIDTICRYVHLLINYMSSLASWDLSTEQISNHALVSGYHGHSMLLSVVKMSDPQPAPALEEQ